MLWLKLLAGFGLAVVLVGALWAGATAGRRDHPSWKVLRRYRYAHRGLHDRGSGIPENSMAAFRLAREHGYGVELDVQLTGDGQLAVIHDKSLKRTTGVEGEVPRLSMAELKRCRLEGTQETIPTLEEVLELFQGGPPLLVELKADYFDIRELVEKAVAALDRYRVNYCIESFHPGVVHWLRKHRPDICRGQLSQDFWRGTEGVAGLAHDPPALQFSHPAGFYFLPLGSSDAPGCVAMQASPPSASVLLDGAQSSDHGAGGAGGVPGDL